MSTQNTASFQNRTNRIHPNTNRNRSIAYSAEPVQCAPATVLGAVKGQQSQTTNPDRQPPQSHHCLPV